jgi:hypothetical protein
MLNVGQVISGILTITAKYVNLKVTVFFKERNYVDSRLLRIHDLETGPAGITGQKWGLGAFTPHGHLIPPLV